MQWLGVRFMNSYILICTGHRLVQFQHNCAIKHKTFTLVNASDRPSNIIITHSTMRPSQLKFIYSEMATKFCEISTLLLTGTTLDKSKLEISQNVAFSECMNFLKSYLIFFHEFIRCFHQFLFH